MRGKRHVLTLAAVGGVTLAHATACTSNVSTLEAEPVTDFPIATSAASSSFGAGAGAPVGVIENVDAGSVVRPLAPAPPLAPQPVFAMTPVVGAPPPPPISGGTLLMTHDGHTAVAADPDRDAVYVVDTAAGSLLFTIALQSGDEPGRVVEDGAGRVHVALRGGGALVTIDTSTGTVVDRRAVCPAPRGAAWDDSTDLVWVACATGELVGLPASGAAATQSFVVQRDLRDVVVDHGALSVTTFRSATVLRLNSDGSILRQDALAAPVNGFSPQVAWRTIAGPEAGTTITVYQEESNATVETIPGGYGGGGPPALPIPLDAGDGLVEFAEAGPIPNPEPSMFGSIVQSAVTVLGSDGVPISATMIPETVLPVDVAISQDGLSMAVAAAGNGFSVLPTVAVLRNGSPPMAFYDEQVIAVAFDQKGNLFAQAREPAALISLGGTTIALAPGASRADTGLDIFHTQAGGLIACASCHPEGGDDGHVWMLDGLPRRTPSLRGTIAGTAPYHWPGDEPTIGALIDDVYTIRMSGAPLDPSMQAALANWVDSIPAPPAPSWVDMSAAALGQALFAGSAQCASCHSGAKFTNNQTVDVGTGTDVGVLPDGGSPPTAFQVPPLVGVGWRTPLLHNACAATVADRFGKCATAAHGATSQLSAEDVVNLTAYLDSL